MVRHYQRPYTSEEIGRLQRWIDSPPPGRYVWALGCTESILVYFLGFSTALIAGMYLEAVWKVPAGLSLSFLAAFALSFLTIRWINRIRRRRAHTVWERTREELQNDLGRGEADAIRATVLDALRVNYWEDFGWGWFLETGSGEIVYIHGLVLDDLRFETGEPEDPEPELAFDGRYDDFPNSEIEIVRTRSGRLIDLRCLGDYIEPSAEIDQEAASEPESVLEYYLLPSQGHVFPGSLATIDDDVARELAALAHQDRQSPSPSS